MSLKTKNQHARALYLKQVRLQGYRTIQDTQMDFEPGLNIIIGKNGVGKSNFLLYLKTAIDFKISLFSHLYATLLFSMPDQKEICINIKSNIRSTIMNGSPTIQANPVTFSVNQASDSEQLFESQKDFFNFLNLEGLLYSTIFIAHGLPSSYPMVNTPFSFKINRTGVLEDYAGLKTAGEGSFCLENVFNFILYKGLEIYGDTKLPGKKEMESLITETEKKIKSLESALKKYTDIKGIRFNKTYNVVFDKVKGEFTVSNLFLDFKVGSQWLPFAHLSDGTRRLFYIVSEVAFPALFYFRDNQFTAIDGQAGKIILIEEPELGLHPRQLDGLLLFLQESSLSHQLIITTHAPQVLDILRRDQLGKITIARLSSNGTKLRHLTAKEREKATLYMEEEAYLSDYWRFSDLEQ